MHKEGGIAKDKMSHSEQDNKLNICWGLHNFGFIWFCFGFDPPVFQGSSPAIQHPKKKRKNNWFNTKY